MKRFAFLAALGAVAIAGAPADALGPVRRHLSVAPRLSTPRPIALTDESLYGTLRVFLSAANTPHMWQEAGSSVQLNRATTDGQNVGQVDSAARGGVLFQSGAQRPTLQTEAGTGISYLRFDQTGGVDRLSARNPVHPVTGAATINGLVNFVHVSRIGTIMLRVGVPVADGTASMFIDNANGTNANRGFWIQRTTGNRVQLAVVTGGATACLMTSTATLRDADGIQWVVARLDGAGNITMNVGDNGANESGTCSGAGAAGDAFGSLSIGAYTSAGTNANSETAAVLIFSDRKADADIARIKADMRGTRTSADLIVERPAAEGFYNFVASWFDLTDVATLYSDTACTVPVTTFNTRIRCVRNKIDTANVLGRTATSSVTNAPIWQTDNGARWAGGGSQRLVWPQWEAGGASTTIVVARNEDATLMSTLLNAGTGSGLILTGASYELNTLPRPPGYYNWIGTQCPGGQPCSGYTAVHTPIPNGAVANPVLYPTPPAELTEQSGFNVVEIQRDGRTWRGTNDGYVTTAHSSTVSNVGAFGVTGIGGDGLTAGTSMHGNIRHVLHYTAVLGDARIARIREGLAAQDLWTGRYPTAWVDALDEPGRSVLGRARTAPGVGSPYSIAAATNPAATGYSAVAAAGISVVMNRDLSPPCTGCTYPTVSTNGSDWWRVVSGTSGTAAGGFFSQPLPTFDPDVGFTGEHCATVDANVDNTKGTMPLAFGSAFDDVAGGGCAGTYEPGCLFGAIGWVYNSTQPATDPLYWCVGRNSCVAVPSAPRDGSRYCGLIVVSARVAGVAQGYGLLFDADDPANPVVRQQVTFTISDGDARFVEFNAVDLSGANPRTQTNYRAEGGQSYAP